MKYKLLLLITLSSVVITYGQRITDAGNNWVIEELNWPQQNYYKYQVRIGTDTVINALAYKSLERNDDITNPQWYNLDTYLRETTDGIVYVLDSSGQEGILYHFGLQPGEEVVLWNGYTARIDSIDSIWVANNQMRRRFHVRAVLDANGEYCSTGDRWIEGIGSKETLLYEMCADSTISGTSCFLHYGELYYPVGAEHCQGFISSNNDIDEYPISVFPNPVTNWLSIQFDNGRSENKNIQLYSPQGQLLYHVETSEDLHRIDMSQIPGSGMYILQVISSEHTLIGKKILKL